MNQGPSFTQDPLPKQKMSWAKDILARSTINFAVPFDSFNFKELLGIGIDFCPEIWCVTIVCRGVYQVLMLDCACMCQTCSLKMVPSKSHN